MFRKWALRRGEGREENDDLENANYFTCNWTKEINYPLDVS